LVNLGPLVNRSGAVHKPVISADDLELYFSVYSGGQMDIWVSTRPSPSDPWGVPVSLGPTVNSPAQDWLAWLSPDGLTALIWSDRPGGYGSLDTWVTTRPSKSSAWEKPWNLGPAFNTKYSDCLASVSPDGRWGYFSDYEGIRPGGFGGSDLWQIPMERILAVNNGKVQGKED
jgi:Tol biopolymer transport system component